MGEGCGGEEHVGVQGLDHGVCHVLYLSSQVGHEVCHKIRKIAEALACPCEQALCIAAECIMHTAMTDLLLRVGIVSHVRICMRCGALHAALLACGVHGCNANLLHIAQIPMMGEAEAGSTSFSQAVFATYLAGHPAYACSPHQLKLVPGHLRNLQVAIDDADSLEVGLWLQLQGWHAGERD